jgi:hypothetical protein
MQKRYWVVLVIITILTPLGNLASATAWGEWAADELKDSLGYVPQGIEQLNDLWHSHALMPDYSLPALGDGTLAGYVGYFLSAVVGSILIYGVTVALTKLLSRPREKAVR